MANGSDSQGIHFGSNNRFGDVNVEGTVAGRDVLQQTTTSGAEPIDLQQLLAVLDQLQAEVMQLKEAPQGDREDARDELRKASEAAQAGDGERVAKKLEGAQAILHTLGENLPAALALGQTIGMLAMKATGLG